MSPRKRLLPVILVVVFATVLEGLSLSEYLPFPIAFLVGAAWGVGVGLVAAWISRNVALSAWLEDALVFLGAVSMGFLAFGGAAGILLYSSALDSPSLSGETLVLMFLPSIPLGILANVPIELFVVPGLLVLGWREGKRRLLIVVAAALFFVHRVWTYLVFASARLDFAETARTTGPLTAAERQQLRADLQLDDPRWMLNLAIFAAFLLAASYSRVRELSHPGAIAVTAAAITASPTNSRDATM